MPHCSNCGKEISDIAIHCPHCGYRVKETTSEGVGAGQHLSLGFKVAAEQPMVFAPVIIGGLISIVIDNIWGTPFIRSGFSPVLFFSGLISLIGSIVNYILNFASIDMSRNAYMGDSLDLMDSINYVLSRFGTFIVASIVGAVMAITIILIPVVIFMFVIIVMDETYIGAAISKAFRVISRDLGDIILILLVAIIGSFVFSYIPFMGSLLNACLNVIIGLSFIDVYQNYRTRA